MLMNVHESVLENVSEQKIVYRQGSYKTHLIGLLHMLGFLWCTVTPDKDLPQKCVSFMYMDLYFLCPLCSSNRLFKIY